MKKLILVVFVLALVGCTSAFVMKMRANGEDDGEGGSAEKRVVQVTRGSVRQMVSCSGYIEPNLDVEIKCKASGTITELPFDISDPVEKGDLLVKLDPVDENRNVQLAEVQLASAEAKLAQAKQNLVIAEMDIENARAEAKATLAAALASEKDLRDKATRMAALEEKEYASTEEVASAEASAVQAESTTSKARVGLDKIAADEAGLELKRQDIKLAEADVERYRIELDDARQRLTETNVYAPIAGVVSSREVQIGQIISSPTSNVSGGTALMELSDLSRVFVRASVDESDIGSVDPGQMAMVSADAFPDGRFRGEVVRVATKGENVSNVVTFDVKIEVLDETKSQLRPEMTADVEILVAESQDVLVVPSEAVRGRGPQKMVLTPADTPDGEPTSVPVQTGLSDDMFTEVVSGLEEGDDILVSDDTGSSMWEQREGGPGGPGGGPPPMMGMGFGGGGGGGPRR